MQAPDWFWKWVALTAVIAFVTYNFLYPNLVAGRVALQYVNACVQAGVCPSPQSLDEVLAKKQPPPPPKPAPSPTPTPEKAK